MNKCSNKKGNYKIIETKIQLLTDEICDFNEQIEEQPFRCREIDEYVDNLQMFSGAWSCREDCTGIPLSPNDDLRFALDIWSAAIRVRNAIDNSTMTDKALYQNSIKNILNDTAHVIGDIYSYQTEHRANINNMWR